MNKKSYIVYMEKIKDLVEQSFFGVCTWWGEKLGISISKIRLFFIYLSFIALGSPLNIYLVMAFILDIRNLFRKKNDIVEDI